MYYFSIFSSLAGERTTKWHTGYTRNEELRLIVQISLKCSNDVNGIRRRSGELNRKVKSCERCSNKIWVSLMISIWCFLIVYCQQEDWMETSCLRVCRLSGATYAGYDAWIYAFDYFPTALDGWLSYNAVKKGYYSKEQFLDWLKKHLIPAVRAQFRGRTPVIVLDNCSIHTDPDVEEILETTGIFDQYLPPYSPDFSPIELTFSVLKAWIWRN